MTEPPADTYVNRFGRKGGRGVRPWLLIPKIICVGIYFGALVAMLAIWLASDYPQLPADDPRRLWTIQLLRMLALYVMVPGLLGAIVFGAILFLQHPRTFLRLRWLRVKVVSLLILIPSAHLLASSRLAMLRDAAITGSIDPAAEQQLPLILLGTIIGSIWIILLGRMKPRLAQNWARDHVS